MGHLQRDALDHAAGTSRASRIGQAAAFARQRRRVQRPTAPRGSVTDLPPVNRPLGDAHLPPVRESRLLLFELSRILVGPGAGRGPRRSTPRWSVILGLGMVPVTGEFLRSSRTTRHAARRHQRPERYDRRFASVDYACGLALDHRRGRWTFEHQGTVLVNGRQSVAGRRSRVDQDRIGTCQRFWDTRRMGLGKCFLRGGFTARTRIHYGNR